MANNSEYFHEGVMLDGLDSSGNLSFSCGEDYSNLAPLNSAIEGMPDQELPSDFNMGSESMPVPLMSDIDANFDGGEPFDYVQPTENNRPQWDGMQGVITD